VLVSFPMVASPRAYRSDRGTGLEGFHRHRPSGTASPGGWARPAERGTLRPRRLLDAWQEAIGGMTGNGQNPGRCRGSVSGVRLSLVVPRPALADRAELPRAKPRHALPRRGGRLAPKGAAPPLRAVMVRRTAGVCGGATQPGIGHATTPTGMVTLMPAMSPSADGLVSDGEWQAEEEDDGPATEVRMSGEPFTARSA
jgi:hypothetical protein